MKLKSYIENLRNLHFMQGKQAWGIQSWDEQWNRDMQCRRLNANHVYRKTKIDEMCRLLDEDVWTHDWLTTVEGKTITKQSVTKMSSTMPWDSPLESTRPCTCNSRADFRAAVQKVRDEYHKPLTFVTFAGTEDWA